MFKWLEDLIFPGSTNRKNPVKIMDQHGETLVILKGSKFESVDLTNVILNKQTIRDKSMVNCIFKGVDGYEVTFQDCDLTNSVFKDARLMMAKFINCNLSRVNFRGANLRGVIFLNSDLTNADLTGSNFENVKIEKCLTGGIRGFHETR